MCHTHSWPQQCYIRNVSDTWTIYGWWWKGSVHLKMSIRYSSIWHSTAFLHTASATAVTILASRVSLLRPNWQTYRLDFWHRGQVEGYLGQVHRWVDTAKRPVLLDCSYPHQGINRLLRARNYEKFKLIRRISPGKIYLSPAISTYPRLFPKHCTG